MNAAKVVTQLEAIGWRKALPEAIRLGRGSEFFARSVLRFAASGNLRLSTVRTAENQPSQPRNLESSHSS